MDKALQNQRISVPPRPNPCMFETRAKGLDVFNNNGKGGRLLQHRNAFAPVLANNVSNTGVQRFQTPSKVSTVVGGNKRASNRSRRSLNLPESNKYVDDCQRRVEDVGIGGRKQRHQTNANYLMNFQFEPRGIEANAPTVRQYKNKSYPTKFNRELYLLSNCQFIVRLGGEYSAQLSNPDVPVEWNNIEQISLKTPTSDPSCPICLYPPKAAKMGKCGHLFCWPCVLHYLALSDDKWRKCPICFQAICQEELRSVVSWPLHQYLVGDTIEMLLMFRQRQSINAKPLTECYTGEFSGANFKRVCQPGFCEKNVSYEKLLVAKPQEVIDIIISRERKELLDLYESEMHLPEACFIKEALSLLSQRENDVLKCLSPLKATSVSKSISVPGLNQYISNASPQYSQNLDKFETVQSEKPWSKRKEMFYFYQAVDGQFIFLHAINILMLEAMQATQQSSSSSSSLLEHCPTQISGRILAIETLWMTLEMRKRFPYLRHLPLGCQFSFCEIEFCDQIISDEIMIGFRERLEMRHSERLRREAKEIRRQQKISAHQDELMGLLCSGNRQNTITTDFDTQQINIESRFDFPDVGSTSVWINKEQTTSHDYGCIVEPLEESTSFAKILVNGGVISEPREDVPDTVDELEGYVGPPPMANMGQALAIALEKAHLAEDNGGVMNRQNSRRKRNRKMFGKTIQLTSGGGDGSRSNHPNI